MVDKELAFSSVTEQIQFTAIASILLYIVIASISTYVVTRLLKPLQTLSDALSELSEGEGDLTQRIEIQRKDEIGELAQHVNQFLAQMQKMLGDIIQHSQQLAVQAEAANQLSQESAQQVETQQNDVNQIATAIHEMSATAAEVASHAELTANASQESSAACEDGQQVIEKTVKRSSNLPSKSLTPQTLFLNWKTIPRASTRSFQLSKASLSKRTYWRSTRRLKQRELVNKGVALRW